MRKLLENGNRVMYTDSITIRPLSSNDLGVVRDLGKRSLSRPMGLLMVATISAQGLVSETSSGAITGAIILRVIGVGKRRLGVIDWVFVDPNFQGLGISNRLADQALEWFHLRECDFVITTDIDGYNSAAWNAAHSRGLVYWPVSQQIRELGWSWIKLMWLIPHMGVTTFILCSATEESSQTRSQSDRGTRMLTIAILILGLILLPLSRIREVLWDSTVISDLIGPLDPTALITGMTILALYMGIRACCHWLVARSLRLRLSFRLWDSGLFVASIVAVAFGGFLPGFGGGFYIGETGFNYRRSRHAMGKIALAGVTASLALFLMFSVWSGLVIGARDMIPSLGVYIGFAFGVTDSLLFFAPFQALPAGLLWLWRREVWLAVFTVFLGIWLVLPQIV